MKPSSTMQEYMYEAHYFRINHAGKLRFILKSVSECKSQFLKLAQDIKALPMVQQSPWTAIRIRKPRQQSAH